MRILRNLLATLLVLCAIVFGAISAIKNPPTFFSMPAELTKLAEQGITLIGGQNGVFFSSVGFCLFAILTVVMSFMGPKRNKDIRVELEGGSVVMSEAAIRSYLENAMTEFPQIGVRRIAIFTSGRGLLVQMQAELKTQQHVPDLEQSIITRIHVALVKELGISKVGQVMVSVSGFRPGAQPTVAAANVANAKSAGKPAPVTSPALGSVSNNQPALQVEPPKAAADKPAEAKPASA